MKKNSYIAVAIVALFASLTLQMIWVVNTFKDTADKISQKIDDVIVNALFEELNHRSNDLPDNVEFEGAFDDYSAYNNYKYINDGVSKMLHNEIDFDTLATAIDKYKKGNLNYSYIIYRVYKNGCSKMVYKSKHQPDYILGSIKSGIIPIKLDDSENIQIAFLNPYNLFLKEMGLILASSFLIALLLIWCIAKQVSLIRIQRKTMQLRKDFTYAMIHDMKSPLSTIVMGIGNLENTKVDERPEARHNCYKILKDEAQHLMKLVDKVLTISKLEEGKLHINKEEVELSPMIADLEEKFSVKARKPLRFQNSIAAEVAYAEEEYLSEAISNLIDNAIKYSGDKPETVIEISSRRTPSGVQISVRDNGMGISKADQKVIFDKFERASASGRTFTKNGPAGFGLGLNYVLQVVEAHGGVVGVDSVVGEYSEFTLLLPNAEDEEEETVNIL